MAAVSGGRMASLLSDRLARWAESSGIDARRLPSVAAIDAAFRGVAEPCRPGADPALIDDWESRHGYLLPRPLRAWLELSNGFYRDTPLIHPLMAIGPMVPFARVPEVVVQPESWFELGNPNVETVCIDLAYRRPGGGHTVFTSGDDVTGSPPRVIATSFEGWFLEMVRHGGREYWFDRGFRDLGHPWHAHKTYAPMPPLPARLRPYLYRAATLLSTGADDRLVAEALGLSRGDVETLFRHLQHVADGLEHRGP